MERNLYSQFCEKYVFYYMSTYFFSFMSILLLKTYFPLYYKKKSCVNIIMLILEEYIYKAFCSVEVASEKLVSVQNCAEQNRFTTR